MKNIRLIFGMLFTLATSAAHANLFNFDGSLTIFDPAGISVGTYPMYTGQINYNTATQIGTANFDPVMFKLQLTIHDVNLTQIGGTLHADGFWDWSPSAVVNEPVSWDWLITALPGGKTSFSLLDTDNDGIPGTAFIGGPFPGFTMAIEGIASPVPVPAAVWLFSFGLMGLVSTAKRKKK